MTTRLSISSLAGTARTLVAVGTWRRGLHVGDDAGGGAAQRLDLVLADRAGALGRGASRGFGRAAGRRARPRRASLGGRGAAAGGLRRRRLSRPAAAAGRAAVGGAAWRRRRRAGRRRGRLRGGLAPRSARPWLRGLGGAAGAARSPSARRRRAPLGALTRAVVLEELPPGPVDGVLVLQVLLVQLVHEPLVRAEGGQRVVWTGTGRPRRMRLFRRLDGAAWTGYAAYPALLGRTPSRRRAVDAATAGRPVSATGRQPLDVRSRRSRSADVGAASCARAEAGQHRGIRGEHEGAGPPREAAPASVAPLDDV